MLLFWGFLTVFVCIHSHASRTIFEFKRKFDTCDAMDLPIPDGPIKLLYAYNNQKPVAEDQVEPHTNRGQIGMRLLDPDNTPIPSNSISFDLALQNATIQFPSQQPGTQYQCTVFALPNLYEHNESHIIRWDAMVDPRNVDVVHHMLTYECPQLTEADVGITGGCFGGGVPKRVSDCLGQTVFAAWAIGGLAYTFPPTVGLPMGPNTTRFVVLETHYSNPTHRPVVDSSGMRFWRTFDLRPNEAGILEQGWFTDPTFVIPPKQQASTWVGYCPSDCTNLMLPKNGVHIVGTILHAHLAGRALSLRHFRGGVELPPISNDPNYDFNFQDIDIVSPEVLLLPGDEFVTTCTYNTMDRTNPTTFGIATENEMCISFSVYYPRTPYSSCRFGNYSAQKTVVSQCANQYFTNLNYNLIGPLSTNCTHIDIDPDLQVPTLLTSFNASHYGNQQYLDDDEQFLFYWRVNHTSSIIEMAVDVATEGWVGLGFSNTGSMVGSDVSIGWIGCDGSVNHKDRFAVQHALPPIDAFQDFFDIRGGFFDDNYTSIAASSPLQCPPPSSGSSSSSLTAGEKAGLAIGLIIAIVLVIGAGFYLYRKNLRRQRTGMSDDDESTLFDTNGVHIASTSGPKKSNKSSYSNLET